MNGAYARPALPADVDDICRLAFGLSATTPPFRGATVGAAAVSRFLSDGALLPVVVEEADQIRALVYGYRFDRQDCLRAWMAVAVDHLPGSAHHARLGVVEWARVMLNRWPQCNVFFETPVTVLENLGDNARGVFCPSGKLEHGIRDGDAWIPLVFGSVDLRLIAEGGVSFAMVVAPKRPPGSIDALVVWLNDVLSIDLEAAACDADVRLEDLGIDSLGLAEIVVAIEDAIGARSGDHPWPGCLGDLLELWHS